MAKSQGASAAKQAQVTQIATKRIEELTTASAIDAKTLAQLSAGSTAPALVATAQTEIRQGTEHLIVRGPDPAAGARVPGGEVRPRSHHPVRQRLAGGQRSDPGSDPATINKYGNILKSAQAGIPPATLAKLQKASKDTPHQWQHWWWVCFIAQIVFIPFIFLLSGRWSPKRAREDEAEHEAMVERELAALHHHAQA